MFRRNITLQQEAVTTGHMLLSVLPSSMLKVKTTKDFVSSTHQQRTFIEATASMLQKINII